ncbi:hypothetical protein WJX82_010585 [Trebouxia sp. C0006]
MSIKASRPTIYRQSLGGKQPDCRHQCLWLLPYRSCSAAGTSSVRSQVPSQQKTAPGAAALTLTPSTSPVYSIVTLCFKLVE